MDKVTVEIIAASSSADGEGMDDLFIKAARSCGFVLKNRVANSFCIVYGIKEPAPAFSLFLSAMRSVFRKKKVPFSYEWKKADRYYTIAEVTIGGFIYTVQFGAGGIWVIRESKTNKK